MVVLQVLFHYEFIYEMGPPMLEKQVKESQSRVASPQPPRLGRGQGRYTSSLIFSPIVDQHSVAITNDEPIEDVDPIAPDVDIVDLDVVMDIPLRRSERARRLAISNDYIVYLQKHEYDIGDVLDLTTYKESIVSP